MYGFHLCSHVTVKMAECLLVGACGGSEPVLCNKESKCEQFTVLLSFTYSYPKW